jgi:hypothetical protein
MRVLNVDKRELDHLRAKARGVRAEPAIERLRSDLENAAETLRDAVAIYLKGTWRVHRALHGSPSEVTDGVLPALVEVDDGLARIEALMPRFEHLLRSAWYQLGEMDRGDLCQSIWPTAVWQLDDDRWNGYLCSDRAMMRQAPDLREPLT